MKFQKGDKIVFKLLALKDSYLRDIKGATAIEYGLIAAGISLAISVVVFIVGDDLSAVFGTMEDAMEQASAEATS